MKRALGRVPRVRECGDRRGGELTTLTSELPLSSARWELTVPLAAHVCTIEVSSGQQSVDHGLTQHNRSVTATVRVI